MSPLDALGLAPMAADMERVETALRGSVLSSDPFLSDVAGHLVSAGGKRLRPVAVCDQSREVEHGGNTVFIKIAELLRQSPSQRG